MTPYEIDILLHYHCRAGDYPHDAPILRDTMECFMAQGLIAENPLAEARYEMTDRGHAYCQALQRVGLPESRWVMTWPKDDPGAPEDGRT